MPSSPHLKKEADPFSEMFFFLLFRMLDNKQSPESQWFWVVHTIVRTLKVMILSSNVLTGTACLAFHWSLNHTRWQVNERVAQAARDIANCLHLSLQCIDFSSGLYRYTAPGELWDYLRGARRQWDGKCCWRHAPPSALIPYLQLKGL